MLSKSLRKSSGKDGTHLGFTLIFIPRVNIERPLKLISCLFQDRVQAQTFRTSKPSYHGGIELVTFFIPVFSTSRLD